VNVCPSHALQFTGSVVTDSQVLCEIIKDHIFYESSSGGITLTGGEPLFQTDFSTAILRSCKEKGIHTAIETCLYTDPENVQNIIEYTDLFITDLKIFDEELHRKFTGRSNEIILQNFRFLAESGKDIIVRIPVIPGITNSAENMDAIRDFVRKIRFDIPVEYINFNPLTRNNYDKLGIPYLI
jgi:pyruvate formate lyase activating enzyme